MITGVVRYRHPTIQLEVIDSGGQTTTVDFVLDTGFTGFMTLPPSLISAMGLPFLNYLNASLADGSRIRLHVHAARVIWNGASREIDVLATDGGPLIGTSLLDGYEVRMRFEEDGIIEISPL